MEYELNGLGPNAFEEIVQALLKQIIGAGTITFGHGPDGGRDATYHGGAAYPSDSNRWSGDWIFQAKFHYINRIGPDKARAEVVNDLRQELNRISERLSQTPCDNYILVTNVPLSSVMETGTHDKIDAVREIFKSKIPNIHVWGYDEICRFLDDNAAVRQAYRHLITTGDVLSSIMTNLSESMIIENENKRRKRKKLYFIKRINDDYDRFIKNYEKMKSQINEYLNNPSEITWYNVDRYCGSIVPNIQPFISGASEDIDSILDILDNPRLVDKFKPMISYLAGGIKVTLENRNTWRYYDNYYLRHMVADMDSTMTLIAQYMQDLNEEITNTPL